MFDRFKNWRRKSDDSAEDHLTEEEIAAAEHLAADPNAVPLMPLTPLPEMEAAAEDPPEAEKKSWWSGLVRTPPGESPAEARAGWLERLKAGLAKTRSSLVGQMQTLFRSADKIDDDFWDQLEAILLQADVGTKATDKIVDDLKSTVRERKITRPLDLQLVLREDLSRLVGQGGTLNYQSPGPTVILVVGVNGTGKTTSIAKLTFFLRMQGHSVMLAAADTFRAAAIDQLEVWADRLNVELVKHKENSDPAAVVFDAVTAAKARNVDVLLIDTAGRLHSKVNLMEELKKIWRVVGRELPGAPHECLLVLDATTGQNALIQAKTFKEAVGITGVVLTKMDGTARGGVVISITEELGVPVKFIGIGEKMDDLHEFSGEDFIDALFLQAAPTG